MKYTTYLEGKNKLAVDKKTAEDTGFSIPSQNFERTGQEVWGSKGDMKKENLYNYTLGGTTTGSTNQNTVKKSLDNATTPYGSTPNYYNSAASSTSNSRTGIFKTQAEADAYAATKGSSVTMDGKTIASTPAYQATTVGLNGLPRSTNAYSGNTTSPDAAKIAAMQLSAKLSPAKRAAAIAKAGYAPEGSAAVSPDMYSQVAVQNALSQGGANYQDITAAQLSDNEQFRDVTNQQNALSQQAQSQFSSAITSATSQLNGMAGDIYQRAIDTQSSTAGQEQVAKLMAQADAITQAGQTLRKEELASATALRESALAAYKNTTAQQVEQQRSALDSQYKQKSEALLATAQQNGMDSSSPYVQQQMQQLNLWKSAQLGSMANDAGIKYNESAAQLRSVYDQLQATVQSQSAATQLQGAEGGIAATKAAGDLTSQYEQIKIAALKAGYDASTQLSSLAAQLQVAGNQTVAEWLKDETIAYTPVAGIISDAFTLAGSYAPSYYVEAAPQSGVSVKGSPSQLATYGGSQTGGGNGGSTTSPAFSPSKGATGVKNTTVKNVTQTPTNYPDWYNNTVQQGTSSFQ
jgi:hypothetical protein